jgi:hypothetical protein
MHVGKFTMIEVQNDGCEPVLVRVVGESGTGFAATKSEEDHEMSSLNFTAGPVTSQYPVSFVGWGGALLIGALIWVMLFFWIV